MAYFTNTPTPIIPLPTRTGDQLLSDGDVLEKLRTGLQVIEDEILELLDPSDGSRTMTTTLRETLSRTRRWIHDLERLAYEQRVVRALAQGERVADVWPVDLLCMVQEVAKPLAVSYRLDHKPLCVETEEEAVVSADPRLLRHAMEALLTCGLEHSMQNTPVLVYLEREVSGGTATVHVISKGCDGHSEQCRCLNRLEERLGARLHFCSQVAQANRGWIAYDIHSSKSLDLTMTLPLVKERRLSVV